MAATYAPTVVGSDGSRHADEALRWAVEEAGLRQAQLRVVHAWPPPFADGDPHTGAAHEPQLLETSAKALLDDGVDADGDR